MKRVLVFLLLVALLVPTLASCGKKAPAPDPSGTVADTTASRTESGKETEPTTTGGLTPSGDETTTATTTADPWEPIAAAFVGLDEAYRTVRIQLDASETAGTGARNPRLFAGPDEVTGETPAAEREIYERNRAARDRLGLTVSYSYQSDACGEQAERIAAATEGANAPDLFVGTLRDLTRATLRGCFRDIYAGAGSYLDLTGDGWLTELIDSTSLTHDRAYILAGDAFPDLYRGAIVLPFNRTLLDNKTLQARLSPCVLPDGETLGAGEKLSDRFFDLIAAGKWTYDTLTALSEAVFSDVGSRADTDDFSDLLGFVCDVAPDTVAAALIATRETDYLAESTDGETGRVTLTYLHDGGSLGDLLTALFRLIGANGTAVTTGGFSDYPDEPGFAAHRRKFASGSLLFLGAVPLGTLGYGEIAATTGEVAVAPLPKLRGSDRYVTPVSPDADAGAINRRSVAFSAVSAYLQYLSENSRTALDRYLASLIGTDAEISTGIVRDSIVSWRSETVEDAVAGVDAPAWRTQTESNAYRVTAADFAAAYSSAIGPKGERLNQLLDTWYGLPKGATE